MVGWMKGPLPLPLRASCEGQVPTGGSASLFRAWVGRLRSSLPPRGAVSYQLTGAHVTEDAHVHPEAIGEGRLQMDVALLVILWQLAHVHPIHVLDGPQLDLVGALRRPHCQPRPARQATRGPLCLKALDRQASGCACSLTSGSLPALPQG